MNKRNIIIIVSLLVFVMIVGGVSYSYFVYNKDIGDVSLTAGEISIDLSGISGNKTLTNVIPISDNEGMISQDYFDFTVNATVDTERIYYEVYIMPDSSNTLDTTYLKTYLTDQTNNAIKGITLFSDLKNSEVENGKVLYRGVIETNQNGTTRNETKAFRFRLWLDETYTELTSKSFNFDVYLYAKNVDDDFVLPGFRNLIASKVSESYISSYDDIINDPSNVGFTTQDQLSTSASKQTVYYYTGEEASANSNVLFAGYCWQIIRTTDNGGVKLLYNGVAKKPVTGSTPISNTDITYTNDATYPYTYDSNTKKWTSSTAGVSGTTDTFIFSVNTSGDYAINYQVSSQINSDRAQFYINGVFLGQHSGEEEGIFDLGTLSTTDVIKIEYKKNFNTDSGNDNIVFDIANVTARGDNPACPNDRLLTKGINGTSGTSATLSSASLYGRSYDYNLATGEFTLEDSTGLPTSWTSGDNNTNGKKDYEELIGTYTCMSSSSTCTTLYYIGSYYNSSTAYVVRYTIGDVDHFSQMGKSAFNANHESPSLVGYMFNKEYDYKERTKSGEYYANAVWNGSEYVLSNGNSGTSPDETHHYICDSTCSKVRYYYYSNDYYILLENGTTIEDALKEMINYKTNASDPDENINVYNSAIKGYIDNWYKKNLITYESYLDNDIVFCNDRSVRDLGGWNPNGTDINDGSFKFNQYNSNTNLNCVNEIDRFSKGNNKAKLDYPISLMTQAERILMTVTYLKPSQNYWTISPERFYYSMGFVRLGQSVSSTSYPALSGSIAVRAVISLKPDIEFTSGTGTYTDPYIVGPIVTRNE